MPLNHQISVFGVKSCKIAKLTADPPGGAAVYGTSTPLWGVKKLVVGGAINAKQLRGDGRLQDANATVDSMTAAIDHAKLSMDALAIMFSTPVVDSGTTPNQLATWAQLVTDNLVWFKLEAIAQAVDYPSGDLLVSIWKCKLGGIPTFGLNEEDFQIFSQPLILAPRQADAATWQQVIRETSVALV